MAALLQRLRFTNRISWALLFACALALATGVPPQALGQTTTTICKRTNPSPDPWATSFQFTGANSWPQTSANGFTTVYPPNPFPLQDTQCRTFNITSHDKYNKFTESPVPLGWTLTNITCQNQVNTKINITGGNPNPAFQPGDNTVAFDQIDPNVTCTFVNTLTCFRPTSLSLPPCTRPGQTVTLDVSTRPTAGADANWTVAPGGPNPTHTSLGAWTALPNNWVRPSTSGAATYTYTRAFHLPCSPTSYQTLQIAGRFAADNNAQVLLNGNLLAQCTGSVCFNTPPTGTPFTHNGPSFFVSGLNTLTVRVGNQSGPTGLSVVARLSAVCGRDCVCGCPPGSVLQGSQCVRLPGGIKGTRK